MATKNLNQKLPAAPVTLPAGEYLRFLQMIEGGMPNGTRAYLVTLDDETGKRRLKPVESGASVVDLEKDLISHLSASPHSNALFQGLRDYCSKRLVERGIKPAKPLEAERAGIILEQCAMLAKSIEQLAVDAIAEGSDRSVEHELRCISQLVRQLGYQADLGADILGSGSCFGDAEEWMMPPSYFPADAQDNKAVLA